MVKQTYIVNVDWAGYSRGIAAYEVEAESEEEAREDYLCGNLIFKETIRDDTDKEIDFVELEEVANG